MCCSFVVSASTSGRSAADILVIDDELHATDSVTQSTLNTTDVCNANRMLVLPDRVSFHDCRSSSSYDYDPWVSFHDCSSSSNYDYDPLFLMREALPHAQHS